MENNLSIAEIKARIGAEIFTEAEWEAWQADSRKGVQQLIQRRKRLLEKRQAKLEAFEARLTYERQLHQAGYSLIAGVDEVGRGPIAGPVVAAAVILPMDLSAKEWIEINDSKTLSFAQREQYAQFIQSEALAYQIVEVSNKQIDQLNILNATKLAMQQALAELTPKPDYALIDAVTVPNLTIPQQAIIKGDQRSLSIAAASIIAKVHRDHWMMQLAERYPEFQFEQNMGYGTPAHIEALHHYGVTPYHRQSFAPVPSIQKRYTENNHNYTN